MNVMFLAAGLGTRLRPITETVPKPALPFLNAPLAAFCLELLDRLKIHNFVVNTHHLPRQIEKLFWSLGIECQELIFSHEPQILGSGGGIAQAIKYLVGKGDFLVANADEVILPHHLGMISDAMDFHHSHKGIATVLTIPHPEVGKKFGGIYGDLQSDARSLLIKTVSKSPVPELVGLHYIGIMILADRIQHYFSAPAKEENIFYDVLARALAAGEQAFAYQADCDWFEVGNPTDFQQASDECRQLLSHDPRPYKSEFLQQVINRYQKVPGTDW